MLEAVGREHGGELHLLVNNAGARWAGTFAETGWENVERHMKINFDAPLRLTEALLPAAARDRRPKRPGRWRSSTSRAPRAESPGANAGGYSAAKFALAGWSDSLAAEERAHGVHVGLVLPGFISTEGFPAGRAASPIPLLRRIVSRPEVVAEAIVECGLHGKAERYAPRYYWLAAAARILAPGLVRRAIAGDTLTPATGSDQHDYTKLHRCS